MRRPRSVPGSPDPRACTANAGSLTLTKDRVLYLNDKRVAPGSLDTQLRAAFGSRTDKTLYLKADAGLAYGAVIETMDQVRRAGIERLGMVTEPARER